jgi:hypothetical protein
MNGTGNMSTAFRNQGLASKGCFADDLSIEANTINATGNEFQAAPRNLNEVTKAWKTERFVIMSNGELDQASLQYQDSLDEHFLSNVFLMFLNMFGTETLPGSCVDTQFYSWRMGTEQLAAR